MCLCLQVQTSLFPPINLFDLSDLFQDSTLTLWAIKSEPPTWLKFDGDWQHKHYYKVQCQIALWLRVSRAGWKKGLLDWNLLSIKYIFSVQSSLALLQLSAVGLKSERWGPECSKEGLAGENNPMRCTRCSSQWLCFFFSPHFTFFLSSLFPQENNRSLFHLWLSPNTHLHFLHLMW